MVEGAYTPPKRLFIPPQRTTSRSSMPSAPAHMPAIRVLSFGAGLAEPDLILGAGMEILSANSFGSPVCGGQCHYRHQPRARHEMLIIKDRRPSGEPMGHFHRGVTQTEPHSSNHGDVC